MKKTIIILLVLAAVAVGLYFWSGQAVAPEVTPPAQNNAAESANVESYLRANISMLSPVPPVLGGTWYVVSVTVDAEDNSGRVEYEDGHINEKRKFTYTTDAEGEVVTLTVI